MSGNFLAIDFETANPSRDSACSIGLVRVKKNKIIHKAVHLIQPPYRDFIFTYIHGIHWKDVASKPTFKDLWKDIKDHFDGIDFIAAHNAKFDASVLKACCARYRIPMPTLPFKCTVQIARNQWKVYPTKLPDVCRYLDIQLKHHEALSDALACAQIMITANQETMKVKVPATLKKSTLKTTTGTRLKISKQC